MNAILEHGSTTPKTPLKDNPIAINYVPDGASKSATFSSHDWGQFRWLLLLTSDLTSVVLSAGVGWVFFFAASKMTGQPASSASLVYPTIFLVVVLPMTLHIWFASYWGHYTRFKPFWTEAREQTLITICCAAVTAGIHFSLKPQTSYLWIVASIFCLLLLNPMMRILVKKTMNRFGIWFQPLIVIGTGDNAESCALTLTKDQGMGYRLVEIITLNKASMLANKNNTHFQQGSFSAFDAHQFIKQVAAKYKNPHFLYALDIDDFAHYRNLLVRLTMQTSNIVIASPAVGVPLTGTQIIGVHKYDDIFLRLDNNLKKPIARICKRMFDIGLACILILLLSPLLISICLILSLDGESPIFSHKRIGRNGKPFYCLKLRTMVPDAARVLDELLATNRQANTQWHKDFKLKNDPRITRVGKFLRTTSIDELPQLWNVVRGEMSLVGPRPIVAEEMSRYGENIAYYTATRPGITGLWQTSGRNDLSYAERVSLDVWYARNWSFWQDIVVLLNTVPLLIRQNGSY